MLVSLRRQARLSLVPGICIAFALASGAYADKDKAPNNATIGLQTADQLPLGAGSRLAPRAGKGIPLSGGCPASTCDGGACKLTQSLDPITDGENQVACGTEDGTAVTGWARCYNLVAEGVTPGANFTVETVTFGVQQATTDDINVEVNLYLACFGCPPVAPGADTIFLATESIMVDMVDEGTMITVTFAPGAVVPAGTDLVVEIVSVDDGTVDPFFSFRAMSNDGGQCGPSFIRADDCALGEWTDLADIGFPDAHLIQSVTGSEGGVATAECLKIPEACGAKGTGPCGEANPGTPGCEDEACCAAVCEIADTCCDFEWEQFCADLAIEIGCALLPCPVSTCDGGDCKLTQSQNGFVDSGNQVACGADGNTTANGWARCYNLVEEGVPEGENLTINSVEFFVQQATIDDINVNVVLYLDCDGCPPGTPGFDATELASVSVVVGTGDVGSFITVAMPAGTVVPAGTDLIVEIENKDDGTEEPVFAFRVGSNDIGQCAPSYIRAADCGLGDWTDLAEIGFPDAHLLQSVSATVGGTPTVECPKIPEACGEGAGPCDEAHPSPGCADVFCCAAVCEIADTCCDFEWEQFCVDLAIEIGCVVAPCVPPKGLEGVPVPSFEDFDSYANGMPLVGVNGWGPWDDTPSVTATVSDVVARSAPHSVLIDNTPDDDEVQQYTGAYCEGQWVYTIWQFVPSGMQGTSYFILLNTYEDNGPPKNWSTQVQFTATAGTVVSDFGGEELPLITDEWVEIRVEIDLDADLQEMFYGGNLLHSKSWSDGVSGGGERNIRAVDLYANTSTAVYYDDVSLVPGGEDTCPWDLDDSGSVGATDLLSLLVNWGPYAPCPPFKPMDFDQNCTVGATDLLKLLANWGPCP